MDTFGNWQRPVFLLGVSQHQSKITNLPKFELSQLRRRIGPSGRWEYQKRLWTLVFPFEFDLFFGVTFSLNRSKTILVWSTQSHWRHDRRIGHASWKHQERSQSVGWWGSECWWSHQEADWGRPWLGKINFECKTCRTMVYLLGLSIDLY